ncbi:MAG: outer membrane beta-barrel protein [Flavobacterium sp.]
MKKIIVFFLVFNYSFSQEEKEFKLSFSGFLETYYAYDFSEPVTEKKLPFMYNYNRHNEFNVNTGLLRVKAEFEKAYASIAVHAGTYVEDNYANESIKVLNEAFIGLYLDEERKSSVEMGILPSYIGFESACNSSNLTLTRSLLAENSPYFMTGLKYTYTPSERWSFSGLLTNGWQKINKPKKDIFPAFGTQIVYKPNSKNVLNWSTFIGEELYANEWLMRYFSNLYWSSQCSENWRIIAGFDIGVQNTSTISDAYKCWLSPIVIAQYSWSSKWQTGFRAEYYQDENNVIISLDEPFKTIGTSANFDYLFNSKVKFRTEARWLNSKERIFTYSGDPVSNNFFVTTSVSFEF